MTTADRLERRARRGYEMGRAAWALRWAVAGVAIASLGLLGCSAPAAPVALGAILFGSLWGLLWAGGEWARGARVGWLAGLIPCLAPATIRLAQEHCSVLCAHLVLVCGLTGLVAGGLVALRSPRGEDQRPFLVAAGAVALVVGAVGCITAGFAAAGGMALAVCAGAVAPLLRTRAT